MAEEQGFTQARARLDEIVTQVRKKDTSLEQSLDLLEEGVRLANQCTELVDHAEWKPADSDLAEPAPEADAPTSRDEPVISEDAGSGEVGPEHTAGEAAGAVDASPVRAAPDDTGGEEIDEYADIFADD